MNQNWPEVFLPGVRFPAMSGHSPSCSRLNAFFAGSVQGVGFRATTRSLASRRKIAGFVRNLDDGRVELVAEGAQRELDLLLDDIAEEMGSLISGTETAWSDATGEFDRFEIRR